MFFIDLTDLLTEEEDQNQYENEFEPESLHLECIRPCDVPDRGDGWPKPLPNKRVIIIDI